jgi:hypothetical protein
VGDTFSAWFSEFPKICVLVAFLFAPIALWAWFGLQQLPSGMDPARKDAQNLHYRVLGVMMLTSPLAAGLVAYGTFRRMRGDPASTGECLLVGARALLRTLATGLVLFSALGIAWVGAAFVTPPSVWTFLVLGVLTVIAFCALFVAVPAAVIERIGPFRALARSIKLTRGRRWRIFCVLFLVNFLVGLASRIVLTLVTASGLTGPTVYLVTLLIPFLVYDTLLPTACAVAYARLRSSKEGTDLDALLRVFG